EVYEALDTKRHNNPAIDSFLKSTEKLSLKSCEKDTFFKNFKQALLQISEYYQQCENGNLCYIIKCLVNNVSNRCEADEFKQGIITEINNHVERVSQLERQHTQSQPTVISDDEGEAADSELVLPPFSELPPNDIDLYDSDVECAQGEMFTDGIKAPHVREEERRWVALLDGSHSNNAAHLAAEPNVIPDDQSPVR
ncbi:MAG: hypothetical protein AAF153_02395, partial [Pseudomonadota bacterium]